MENRPCLVEAERAFAYEEEDLVTLRPGRDHSSVDIFVERMLQTYQCRLLKVCPPLHPELWAMALMARSICSAQRYMSRQTMSALSTNNNHLSDEL